MRFMVLSMVLCVQAACGQQLPESRGLLRWLALSQMQKAADKTDPSTSDLAYESAAEISQFLQSNFLDLGADGQRFKKTPVADLNLTDECSLDVQFFRNAKRSFLQAKIELKHCLANDTACQKTYGQIEKSNAWFLQQVDAQGRVPAGILRLNPYWLGSYRECIGLQVDKPNDTTRPYKGKYCYAMLSLRSILGEASAPCPAQVSSDPDDYAGFTRLALCVPDSCTNGDTMALMEQNRLLKSMTCNVFCIEDDIEFTTSAIAMIAVLSVIGVIVLVGTVCDYFNVFDKVDAYSARTPISLLLAFSLYSNGAKILNISKRSGQLECLHGIRVLSMFWVILGHTYLHLQYIDNIADAVPLIKSWGIQAINNATFSVDTFFTMSGFLVAFLWLKEMQKGGELLVKSVKGWIVYYVHRYVRLTPVYMLLLGVSASLLPYFVRGPNQFFDGANMGKHCASSWWTNLLYINNVVKPDEQCYGVAWYLPNDMQFYALSPILLILFYYSPVVAMTLAVTLILGSIGGVAATIVLRHFPAMTMVGPPVDDAIPKADQAQNSADYWRLIYMSPWARYPPYVIGLIFGYLWQQKLRMMKRIPYGIAILLWCKFIAAGLALVYGLHYYASGNQLDLGVRAFYGSVCRSAWSLCICWVIFACLNGVGGPINRILSWQGWMPISRLSYCMYLLHFMVITTIVTSDDFPLHWDNHFNWVSKWVTATVITMVVSFVVSCALEAPIIHIEKLILHPHVKEVRVNSAQEKTTDSMATDKVADSTVTVDDKKLNLSAVA